MKEEGEFSERVSDCGCCLSLWSPAHVPGSCASLLSLYLVLDVYSRLRDMCTRECVFEEKRRKYGGTSEGRRVKEGERGFGKMSRATSAQSRWRGGSEREKERKAAAKVSSSSQASVAISTHQETTKEIIVMHTCLSCSGLASRVPRRRRRRRPSLARSSLSLFLCSKGKPWKERKKTGDFG